MDKDFLTWFLTGLVALLTTIGGWVFKQIFGKLKELEDEHNKHKYYVHEELAKIRSELAINAERDQANHSIIIDKITDIRAGQEKIFIKLEEYDKNISLFYQQNPNIKNPEL